MKIKSTAASALTVALALLAATVSNLARADIDPTAEYAKKIKSAQVVGTLGPDLVGDSTNLYTGATSFNVNDVSLPGNNSLSVAIGRKFEVSVDHWEASNTTGSFPMTRLFGDWDLDIPYISGIYSNQYGWEIDSTTPEKRCSVNSQQRQWVDPVTQQTVSGAAIGAPRGYPQPYVQWWPTEFWHGVDLHLPGGGSQSLLVADQAAVGKPTTGGPYHWTTKNDWWISCLSATANGAPGEAFVALSPNGDKYTFNFMTSRWVEQLFERICPLDGIPDPQGDYNGTCDHRRIARKEYMLLPTRVEDRFGNWVEYHWSADAFARLTSITSKDGRTIQLTYNNDGLISAVNDGTRTWTYEYSTTSAGHILLSKVNLPGNSGSWQYSLQGLPVKGTAQSCAEIGEPAYCYAPPVVSGTGTGYIIHPSGARVDFEAKVHFKPSGNYAGQGGGSYPLGLISKTISGPGLTTATWTYSYGPTRGEFLDACGPTRQTCPAQITADTTGPDNSATRSTFGIVAGSNQGMLLNEVRGTWSGSTIVPWSTTTYTYADPNQSNGYVALVGTSPQAQDVGIGDDSEIFFSERRLPIKVRSIAQQGATLTSSTTGFNAYAQPASVTRSSTGLAGPANGYSRTEATIYRHDTAKWVIGQVATVTDVGTGRVVKKIDYDSASSLPIRMYSFDLLQRTLSYNADGTLASIKDGNNNVTTVANWYRGVPQLITFPLVDGVVNTRRATVNNLGDLASSTDELGSTSSYGYDAMGRLTRITYPTGDSPAWNPMLRGFTQLTALENGVPAGYWRQTVEMGKGKTTTYYDARWQPVLTVAEDTDNPASKSFVVKHYDDLGRNVFTSYPVGSLNSIGDLLSGISTTYDALGRPLQVSQASELGPLLTTTEYLTGFQTRVTNPRSYRTTTSYQVFDAPSTDAPVRIISGEGQPEQQTTTITRDVFGKPLTITRSGAGG